MKKLTLLLVLIVALMSCEKNEPELQKEYVSFYNWDMKTVNEMVLDNPISPERIESFTVAIMQDIDIYYIGVYDFNDYGEAKIEGNKIILTINDLDIFNSDMFDNTNQFRGQVIIKYY